MKLTRAYGNGITIEVEGDQIIDVFEQLAHADAVFSDIECAAKVDGEVLRSSDVQFNVRRTEDGDPYYEMICKDHTKSAYKFNRYKKTFSQNKKGGTLYYKHKELRDKEVAGLNGWVKYVGGEQNGQSERPRDEPRQERQESSRRELVEEEIPF